MISANRIKDSEKRRIVQSMQTAITGKKSIPAINASALSSEERRVCLALKDKILNGSGAVPALNNIVDADMRQVLQSIVAELH